MRRTLSILVAAGTLAACSGGTGRSFTTYYDPAGLFRTDLPAANSITVAPPQPGASGGPGLLTGVIAEPPQPSPSPSSALGGSSFLGAQPTTDQTFYEAFAYTTQSFEDLDQMTLYFLTGDPSVDVQEEQDVRIDDHQGRLVVADVSRDGAVAASIAVAMTLGSGGTGYVVGAIFPPGTWDHERADFFRVLTSFRATVPPAMQTYPLQPQAA